MPAPATSLKLDSAIKDGRSGSPRRGGGRLAGQLEAGEDAAPPVAKPSLVGACLLSSGLSDRSGIPVPYGRYKVVRSKQYSSMHVLSREHTAAGR